MKIKQRDDPGRWTLIEEKRLRKSQALIGFKPQALSDSSWELLQKSTTKPHFRGRATF